MDTFNRRMKLLAWLKKGRHITLRRIVERFEISRRTALKDMEYLSLENPIRAISGRNGGYEWSGARELTLTEREVALAVDMINEAGITLKGAAGAVVVKMRRFVGKEK